MLSSPWLPRLLFAIPMLLFGILHFGPLEFSVGYVPPWLPGPAVFWVYLAGVGLIAFAISAFVGKRDRLAAQLLALELLLFAFLSHLPAALDGDFARVIAVFRDIAMAGAALMYAQAFARDATGAIGFGESRPPLTR